MRLVDNWRAVLKHAWTVRIAIFAALLNGIAVTVAIITGAMPFPPIWLAIVNGVLTAAVPIVRLIPQKPISGDPDADE
ncbi:MULTISPECIES: hypothetical protein [unclassified Mesorhizobium]|uniref:DUF7940 domain-containing protein n=1 Tax=unclassified Mesorhizobium TaxID=325217 RepID=UPI000FCCC7F1|nr:MULTISPECIES: hypothetical protein [unclassified Mesorhizobium]TGP22284.1 hypothetical protein EN874_019415 [Mesorhizobium sp. M1D.F.Ca.ET.231.01.1.1]TGP24746.1 hypothetical protein EN877_30780 [Mesorhizobium sp. M1D.F.Ca.ET.234.01.1.1]TGS37349.1 hypothetical protein EN827_31085 [Mesorhizobium sp. M1D.F.Ca.ET.184.01.1.1]TGS58149.1 hypothetical protein EN826_031060 [Mesorhizobium sp. M1D.F.Ca.ET.183.01.1.1]